MYNGIALVIDVSDEFFFFFCCCCCWWWCWRCGGNGGVFLFFFVVVVVVPLAFFWLIVVVVAVVVVSTAETERPCDNFYRGFLFSKSPEKHFNRHYLVLNRSLGILAHLLRMVMELTPLKTNMSPENQWLEDVFPTEIVLFLWDMLVFGGVITLLRRWFYSPIIIWQGDFYSPCGMLRLEFMRLRWSSNPGI